MRSRWIEVVLVLSSAALVALASTASAQLTIPSYTVDCGGGRSTGASFAVMGTAGQSDAGRLSGGSFTISGGFWGGGGGGTSAVGDPDPEVVEPTAIPLTFHLYPPGPNPVTESMLLAFDLPEPRLVRAEMYDAGGRLVRVLARDLVPAGKNQRTWDGRDQNGNRVPPGIYFVRFFAGNDRGTHKVVVLH